MSEVLALVVLAASLLAAIARWRWAPDWAVAAAGAVLLVAVGVLSTSSARSAVSDLGPTVGFLAALLILADGCRRAGMFDALGAMMALGSRGRPVRLLAMVFLVAAATTAVLSLDATVVLLTPIVFATAARLRTNSRPHVYACTHLANSASLLLPVSNLTNLLAFRASGLSFTRFGALMVLPWLVALRSSGWSCGRPSPVSWGAPRRVAAEDRRASLVRAGRGGVDARRLRAQLTDRDRARVGGGGRRAGARAARAPSPAGAASQAAEPAFLVFVLGLGIVVHAASQHGLASAVDSILPHGSTLPALLAVAAISAVVANLFNNLPATLIILPVVAVSGPGAVLAMLVGVNAGPNLTYVGLAGHAPVAADRACPRRGDRHGRVHAPGDPHRPADPASLHGRHVVGSAGRVMRVVIWISEDTWEGCVDRARALLPEDAEITLLHVAPSEVEELASQGGARLFGRHPPPPPGPPLRAIAEEEAQAVLESRPEPARPTGRDRLAPGEDRARGARGVRGRRPARSGARRRGRAWSPRASVRGPGSSSITRPARYCSSGPSRRRASTRSSSRRTFGETGRGGVGRG